MKPWYTDSDKLIKFMERIASRSSNETIVENLDCVLDKLWVKLTTYHENEKKRRVDVFI